MKRIITVIVLCITCALSFAGNEQETLATYTMSYFGQSGQYNIDMIKSADGNVSFCIGIAGEHDREKTYMIVDCNDMGAFLETLQNVRKKYAEWTDIAEKNNVTDINKEFPYMFKHVQYAWYDMGWHMSSYYDVVPRFLILNDGRMLVVMTKKVCSFKNRHMTEDTYVAFSNVNEIDDLINKLNAHTGYDFSNSGNSKEDLFN